MRRQLAALRGLSPALGTDPSTLRGPSLSPYAMVQKGPIGTVPGSPISWRTNRRFPCCPKTRSTRLRRVPVVVPERPSEPFPTLDRRLDRREGTRIAMRSPSPPTDLTRLSCGSFAAEIEVGQTERGWRAQKSQPARKPNRDVGQRRRRRRPTRRHRQYCFRFVLGRLRLWPCCRPTSETRSATCAAS